jgi:hypothetical protein
VIQAHGTRAWSSCMAIGVWLYRMFTTRDQGAFMHGQRAVSSCMPLEPYRIARPQCVASMQCVIKAEWRARGLIVLLMYTGGLLGRGRGLGMSEPRPSFELGPTA